MHLTQLLLLSAPGLLHAAAPETRALPNALSGGYAPSIVPCPANRPRVRDGSRISTEETAWLKLRRRATVEPMIEFLTRAGLPGFDVAAYIRAAAPEGATDFSALPNVAIAASGGGYRALMNGAGFVAAADSRTTGATDKGGIGGLLQSSTYLAGLSGGGWLVGSIMVNNFSTVEALRDGGPESSIWEFDSSIFMGPRERGLRVLNTAGYWKDVVDQVDEKRDAGFEASLTDYWGRALAYQLIDAPNGGPAYTFSSIADTPAFQSGDVPFPILVSDGRSPGEKLVSLNATVYEFNPFELGTFDPTTYGFVPLKYLASNFSAGVIPPSGSCVTGFDSASFVLGTSSSLFNVFLLQNFTSTTPSDSAIPKVALDAVLSVLTDLDASSNDIAQYAPNPFLSWSPATNPSATSPTLDLVDGGEDLQNLPLTPLLSPLRSVDVIFAVDSSADTPNNFPNATALRATYDRSLSPIANGTLFPPVPSARTFVNLGLNARPVFFGCDATALPAGPTPPLIVYVPNSPYSAWSNVSTFTSSYPTEERNAIIRNGYEVATQGNGTVDAEWPACVACAVLSRSLARTGTAPPAVCKGCFERYCWNGETDEADKGEYQPSFKLGGVGAKDSGVGRLGGGVWGVVVAVVVGGGLVM